MGHQRPAYLPSRVLHVYRDGHVKVLDSDKSTVLYTVDTHCRKPNVRVSRPFSPAAAAQGGPQGGEIVVGSANFHTFSRTVDLELGALVVPLEPIRLMTRSRVFRSSVGPLTWQYDSALGSDMKLVNFEQQCFASFAHTTWSWKKDGRLEIMAGVEVGAELLDEIVVSAMAMLELERMANGTANA